MNICIATRKSPLALWQAQWVGAQLEKLGATVRYHALTTQGDLWLENRLAQQGGKGLFVRELEEAVLRGEADLAVHSMKDLPFSFPEGLGLIAVTERLDPEDAFVSPQHANLAALPKGARVGTASLRRQVQIRAKRPDLEVLVLRGNVGTRLEKIQAGQVDAAVMAAAGLKRLGLEQHIRHLFSVTESIPAIGQGALGLECRLADKSVCDLLAQLQHAPTAAAVTAERAFGQALGTQCGHAVGALGQVQGQQLILTVWVGQPSTLETLEFQVQGPVTDAVLLGQAAAQHLIEQGALRLLGIVSDGS